MSFKSWLALLGLSASAFIFNTSEFIPIGLLTHIASDFSITEAHAGMLISVYAWVVMLLSLPLMILVSRMEMRRLMLGLVGLFAAFQVMSSLSNSYGMLMVSRIGVACSHSVFWAIVSPMAARMVSERHRSIALSLVRTRHRSTYRLAYDLSQHRYHSGFDLHLHVFHASSVAKPRPFLCQESTCFV